MPYPSHPNTPTTSHTTPVVLVIAADARAATALVAHIDALLGTQNAFALQALSDTTQLIGHGARSSTPVVALFLASAMQASNATASAHTLLERDLRTALERTALPTQILYANDVQQRLDAAVAALCNWFPHAPALQAHKQTTKEHGNWGKWAWNCEKCSDPECELRLFKGLLANEAR